MLASILKVIPGFFKFTGYVMSYFKDKSIRDTQETLDMNRIKIKSLEATIERERKEHEFVVADLEQMYLQRISEITDNIDAEANPVVGAREILG